LLKNGLIRLIIGLSIIGFLISSFDPRAILDAIISAQPKYLALAILVYPLTLLILTLRWRSILSQLGGDLPLAVAYQVFVGGLLLSDLTPARLGDLSRPLLMREWVDLGKGAVSVAIDKYADLLTILILGFSGLVLLNKSSGRYLLVAAVSTLLVISVVSLFWLHRSFLMKAIKGLGYTRFMKAADALDNAVSSVDGFSGLLARSILITMVAWLTQAARTALVVRAFGFDVPLHVLFLLQPLLSALSLIPITVSGLGLIEGGVTAMLAGLGVPSAIGMSIALTDRILTVAIHILVGSRYAIKLK
jgi:uncharacterized protein (TIRG00374 family)